ncbi:MAG: hypothetical protein KDA96_02045 [Planctomycetaceae bacterium]|nr:hypothetical protein [Planctomycetaceae bacterium]
MKLWQRVICLSLATVVCLQAGADEPKKGKGKGQQKAPSATQRLLNGIELTPEQKEKVAAIDKEFAAKFTEFAKQRSDLLTADQKKAQQAAQKAAREAGKSAAESRKAVNEALKLTDEQAAKMKEIQKGQTELNGRIVAALKKVLTEEQAAKLPKQRGNAGKPNAKKKKTDA